MVMCYVFSAVLTSSVSIFDVEHVSGCLPDTLVFLGMASIQDCCRHYFVIVGAHTNNIHLMIIVINSVMLGVISHIEYGSSS